MLFANYFTIVHHESILIFFFFGFSVFLGPHPGHIQVPRLGVLLELAYATATAMPDLSHVCNLHHSSQQCRVLDPLREAKD